MWYWVINIDHKEDWDSKLLFQDYQVTGGVLPADPNSHGWQSALRVDLHMARRQWQRRTMELAVLQHGVCPWWWWWWWWLVSSWSWPWEKSLVVGLHKAKTPPKTQATWLLYVLRSAHSNGVTWQSLISCSGMFHRLVCKLDVACEIIRVSWSAVWCQCQYTQRIVLVVDAPPMAYLYMASVSV